MIERWCRAFNTSADAVTELYASGAVLLPTLDPDILFTPDFIWAYMDDLIEQKGVTVKLVTRETVWNAVDYGYYDFYMGQKVIHSRYDMFHRSGIVLVHHSSVVPE